MVRNEDTEKVTITLPRELLARVDKMAEDANLSRSSLIASLVDQGYRQASVTRRLLSNKYILRAFQLVFKITPEGYDKEIERDPCKDPATEAVRRTVLNELKKISLAEAQADIEKDFELDSTASETK